MSISSISLEDYNKIGYTEFDLDMEKTIERFINKGTMKYLLPNPHIMIKKIIHHNESVILDMKNQFYDIMKTQTLIDEGIVIGNEFIQFIENNIHVRDIINQDITNTFLNHITQINYYVKNIYDDCYQLNDAINKPFYDFIEDNDMIELYNEIRDESKSLIDKYQYNPFKNIYTQMTEWITKYYDITYNTCIQNDSIYNMEQLKIDLNIALDKLYKII